MAGKRSRRKVYVHRLPIIATNPVTDVCGDDGCPDSAGGCGRAARAHADACAVFLAIPRKIVSVLMVFVMAMAMVVDQRLMRVFIGSGMCQCFETAVGRNLVSFRIGDDDGCGLLGQWRVDVNLVRHA